MAVYFGTRYYEKVEEYHEAATLGAGIAFIQTATQTYLPKFGWIVADVKPEDYAQVQEPKKAVEKKPAVSIDDKELNELLGTQVTSIIPTNTADDDADLGTLGSDIGGLGDFTDAHLDALH